MSQVSDASREAAPAGWIRRRFESFDGVGISYLLAGRGRPVVLLHGFLADAESNWIAPGIADRLLEAGYLVIAPDLRGHGRSQAPTDPAAWPRDVLVEDQRALLAELGLTDFDLAGYSLGARTAARLMVRGARPRRAVLGGMGASGIMEAGARARLFEDAIRNGEAAADPRAGRRIQAMMLRGGLSPEAMLGVLASFAPTTRADLAGVPVATLAVCGRQDEENGSPEELAEILPAGECLRVPGDHLSAVAEPLLADAVVAFLRRP